MRDTSRDGLTNRIEAYVLTHFPHFWEFVMAIPPLRRWVNKKLIGRAARRAASRPHAFSSMPRKGNSAEPMAGYTSWESLTDRDWFSRHLEAPTRAKLPRRPPEAELAQLFAVPPGDKPVLSEDSSVLFLSFAQWFTDGFLMTDAVDRRRTHTSHQIDLNPLYGLTRAETNAIRMMSEESGKKGRLKVEDIGGEIYAPKLYDETGTLKPEFKALRPPLNLERNLSDLPPAEALARRRTIFAFAGERANTTPFTAMLSTLFLREHNRLAGILEHAHGDWDDERIFQTARNINIAQLIKIVVEDYINHISPYYFQLTADPSVCWRESWNKPNWIPIEFNLLYRWHSLVPDYFEFGGKPVASRLAVYDNAYLTASGLAPLAASASRQRAWRMGLFNTAPGLVEVEILSVKQGRDHDLGSYNDYREAYGYPRVERFEQITGDPRRVQKLQELYGTPDKLEYFVGLFAEDVGPRAATPPLIGRMVALDAFSQALTNPLLSENVYNEKTFSAEGFRELAATRTLNDVVNRNRGPHQAVDVSMQYREKQA